MRHRAELVEMASQHIRHMHKALTQMNVRIQHVISDITGLTGLAIVDSIIEGERDPAVLAELRDPHLQASEETIRKSLEGNWRPEHVFTLQQSRRSYRHYQEQTAVCDEEIEKLLVAFNRGWTRKNGPAARPKGPTAQTPKRRGKARPLSDSHYRGQMIGATEVHSQDSHFSCTEGYWSIGGISLTAALFQVNLI
jgi:hypothetical protein